MASAYPRGVVEPDDMKASEPQHMEALEQENKELKDLVVQLSKLVVKYVMAETSAVDSGRPAAILAPLGREAAKMHDPEVPTSILGATEVIK